MRRRLVSLVAAAVMSVGLVAAVPSAPASATGVCAGALGTATLGAPLVYPGVALTPTWASFAVSFTVGTCVNANATTSSLSATGVLNGYCGMSSGSGVTNDGHTFGWVSAGSMLVLTGGLEGVVNAVPDTLNGESCVSGADSFLVSGAAAKHHCTVQVLVLTPTALLHYWTHVCVIGIL